MKESKKNLIELIIQKGISGPYVGKGRDCDIDDFEDDIIYHVSYIEEKDLFILKFIPKEEWNLEENLEEYEIHHDFYYVMEEIYNGGYRIPEFPFDEME